MLHPKMKYTYVGIDSHKDTHTAVFLDCFFEKRGEIAFENLPSKFGAFLSQAEELMTDGTTLLFGLEDVTAYGRTLVSFLKANNQPVKHVNAMLVAKERKNQNITQKTDAVDAECAARVLLSRFSELPDAIPEDNFRTLRTLVVRRDFIVKNNMCLKSQLHHQLTQHYPNYRKFFGNIDCKTSLTFYDRYPSPSKLIGTTVEELTKFLFTPSQGKIGAKKAQEILDGVHDTAVEYQEIEDMTVRSIIRQIRFNMEEIKLIETTLAEVLTRFNTTLTTMTGIETVTACQLLSCIGDIRKFPTSAKLARYAGIAPVTYASGKKDVQFANQRGNRELNSLIFNLAVRISAPVGPKRTVINPYFYEYYHRKLTEGKTKRQALKCVQRRLVNIIWNMLTHKKPYLNPEMYCEPKKTTKSNEM